MLRCFPVKRAALLSGLPLAFLTSCSTPPKADIPALTPQTAAALLQVSPKAKVWLEHVRKENPACEYKLDIPDQTNHPTTVDVDHAISCGGRPSPRALDATVTFGYDKASGRWTISRFSS